MHMKRWIKVSLTAVIFAIAASSWAFHEDKPSGAEFHPEQSQDQVRQQQNYQMTKDEMGQDEREQKAEVNLSDSSDEGATAIARNEQDRAAKDVLKEAKNDLDHRGSSSGVWFAGFLVIAGFGGVMAARTWANKRIPYQERKF